MSTYHLSDHGSCVPFSRARRATGQRRQEIVRRSKYSGVRSRYLLRQPDEQTVDIKLTQRYCCVMIPALIDLGAPCPWAVLPPGIHLATLEEVRQAFATTPHRTRLFNGLMRAIAALELAGCRTLYLDGSFVTAKPHPGDFDGCWEIAGVDPARLDPVLLDFEGAREAQKAKYGGELFLVGVPGAFDFLSFFQVEKFSGMPKGILRLELSPKVGVST